MKYRIPVVIAFIFLAMNLVGLDRSPVVWVDEVTLNDPAKELAFNGVFRSSVLSNLPGFEKHYFWQPPGQPLITAVVYKIFGLGIWQTRIPPVLFGTGLILAIYFLALRLFHSPRAALFSSVIFALDPKLIQTVRSGRMDAQCLFLSMVGVFLYAKSRENTARRYLWLGLSGLLVGLAGLTHPVAICWALAIGLLIVILERDGRVKSLVCFAVMAGVPAALWLGYAWVTAPADFVTQFMEHGHAHVTRQSVLASLVSELQRCFSEYRLVPLLLVAYAIGFVWLICFSEQSGEAKITLAVLFLVPFLFDTIFMVKFAGFYYLHPFVILALACGAMLGRLVPASWFPRNLSAKDYAVIAFTIALGTNLLLGGIGGRYLALATQWQERDYRQVESKILQIVLPGSLVWGTPKVWYAVVKAGASLRFGVAGEARNLDPNTYDFAVIEGSDPVIMAKGFRKIAEIGAPLPPVFGKIRLGSEDYRMQVWQSTARDPRTESADSK